MFLGGLPWLRCLTLSGPMLAAVRARPAARLSLSEGEDEVAAGTVGVGGLATTLETTTPPKVMTNHYVFRK